MDRNRIALLAVVLLAGGLILMAEASSGCLCGYSLQTSLALVPAGNGP